MSHCPHVEALCAGTPGGDNIQHEKQVFHFSVFFDAINEIYSAPPQASSSNNPDPQNKPIIISVKSILPGIIKNTSISDVDLRLIPCIYMHNYKQDERFTVH